MDNINAAPKDINDKVVWMGNTSGKFNVKSAYHILRKRKDKVEWSRFVWLKGRPSKISFFSMEGIEEESSYI